MPRGGIRLRYGEHNLVRGNDISGIQGSGIDIIGSNSEIIENRIHNNCFGIYGGGTGNVISRNLIYDNEYDNVDTGTWDSK
jgi:parallel beta-helix repeat protein